MSCRAADSIRGHLCQWLDIFESTPRHSIHCARYPCTGPWRPGKQSMLDLPLCLMSTLPGAHRILHPNCKDISGSRCAVSVVPPKHSEDSTDRHMCLARFQHYGACMQPVVTAFEGGNENPACQDPSVVAFSIDKNAQTPQSSNGNLPNCPVSPSPPPPPGIDCPICWIGDCCPACSMPRCLLPNWHLDRWRLATMRPPTCHSPAMATCPTAPSRPARPRCQVS